MSQLNDISKAFRQKIADKQIEPEVAIDLFIDVIGSLEWDLEDEMDGDFDSLTNYDSYIISVRKAAKRILNID